MAATMTLKMVDGHLMPAFGIGVWDMRGSETFEALKHAVDTIGYRHIEWVANTSLP